MSVQKLFSETKKTLEQTISARLEFNVKIERINRFLCKFFHTSSVYPRAVWWYLCVFFLLARDYNMDDILDREFFIFFIALLAGLTDSVSALLLLL